MGEVYLAEDTRLDRKVALKFLPQYLQQDEVAQKRFVREAKSAAAIDHPYVCKIYEPGETKDYSFIAMEFVEGETLQKKIDAGRLSLKKSLHIASEISEALEEAHEKGIVHRDLKPANIMLTPKGHVKVMDFGLAKRLQLRSKEEEITATLTREGTTLGTVTYVSPEQLRGRPADTRSDIFSFGVILYEMLTGVHPFRTGTQAETINSILNEHPSAISRYTEDTSDILEHTVEKMLAKAPADRYQLVHEVSTNLKKLSEKLSVTGVSARELAAEVKPKSGIWLRAAAVLVLLTVVVFAIKFYQTAPKGVEEAPIDSIAILPFENESEDPETEYLGDRIADNIAFKLAPLSGLSRVISSDQLRRYKGQPVDAQTAAQEQRVRTVLTATLRVIGDGKTGSGADPTVSSNQGSEQNSRKYARTRTSVRKQRHNAEDKRKKFAQKGSDPENPQRQYQALTLRRFDRKSTKLFSAKWAFLLRFVTRCDHWHFNSHLPANIIVTLHVNLTVDERQQLWRQISKPWQLDGSDAWSRASMRCKEGCAL
jgi:serine/threonine protein kinase